MAREERGGREAPRAGGPGAGLGGPVQESDLGSKSPELCGKIPGEWDNLITCLFCGDRWRRLEIDTREEAEASVQDRDDSRRSRNVEKTVWGPDVEVMSSRSPRVPLQAHGTHTTYVQGLRTSSCTGISCGSGTSNGSAPRRMTDSSGRKPMFQMEMASLICSF